MTASGVPDGRLRVLLIDDSELQAERIRDRLRPYGIGLIWRPDYPQAAGLLRECAADKPIDLVLIDQVFDCGAATEDLLLAAHEVLAGFDGAGWDLRLHQGFLILARLASDMREGSIPTTPMAVLTHYARLSLERYAHELGAGYLSKRQLIVDPVRALGHLLSSAPTRPDRAAPVTLPDQGDVLVTLAGEMPVPWRGIVVGAADVGPLSAARPEAVTVWAPRGRWPQACSLLAMCPSAMPENCLVLTDVLPRLNIVPRDVRIAAAERGRLGAVRQGLGGYACGELRSDRIFRRLLAGRAGHRPELAPVLTLHALARTRHGRRKVQRWSVVIAALFSGSADRTMPDELRADLEEFAQAAKNAQHAVTGGFHALDRVVRGPAEWSAGARRYLALAASMSPTAQAVVDRWLEAASHWDLAPTAIAEHRRLTAARILHRLADDPWLHGRRLSRMVGEDSLR
jgi:hypothetical protein